MTAIYKTTRTGRLIFTCPRLACAFLRFQRPVEERRIKQFAGQKALFWPALPRGRESGPPLFLQNATISHVRNSKIAIKNCGESQRTAEQSARAGPVYPSPRKNCVRDGPARPWSGTLAAVAQDQPPSLYEMAKKYDWNARDVPAFLRCQKKSTMKMQRELCRELEISPEYAVELLRRRSLSFA